MAPARCCRMIGMTVLACHDRAAQIDGADAVEGLLSELEQRRIATGNADTDIVMQNVDVAPALLRSRYGGGKRRFLGDVGLEGDAFATALLDHRHGLLGGSELTIDSHNFGAFLCKSQHRGTPVAHPFAWALTGADNNGGLSF